MNEQNLGRALAAFQRTLIAVNSPFDRYMRGDTSALSPEQLRGMERFQSTGCVNCHSGPMFSDFAAHVLAVPDNPKLPESDSGVNKTYGFRTPSLRNLARDGALHAQRRVRDACRKSSTSISAISRGGGRRGGRVAARPQHPGRPRSDRSAGAPPEHARPRPARSHRVPARAGRSRLRSNVPERVPSGLTVGGTLVR